MGDSSKTQEPQAPKIPTMDESLQAFLRNYPQLVQADIQQSPVQAQAQLDLIKQFAGPTGLAMREAQEMVSPELADLQKKLVGQVTEGISGNLPDVLKDQYLSDIRANLGTNVGSQIGASSLAQQLFGLGESRRQSFINPALSLLGGQPVAQAVAPGLSQTASSFNPGQALSFSQGQGNQMANIFGTQASLYANQPSDLWGQMIGGLAGSATGALGSSIGNAILPGIGGMIGGSLGSFTNMGSGAYSTGYTPRNGNQSFIW